MRVGGIYVDIRGDITQLKKDMDSARHIVRQAGTDISDSLNNALSPKQIESQLNTLIRNLGNAQRASKLTASAFDGIGVELKELQNITGISADRFQKLQSQMLQTRAQQQAERAFNAIARATNASTLQMIKMRMQMGDIQGGLKQLNQSVSKTASSVLNLKNAFIGLGLGYIAKDLFETGRSTAQMQKAFVEITGSTQDASKEFDFLRDVADRLGQNFWNLQDSYKGLLAASKDTTLAGQATRDVFEAVTKASATLGLSSEKTERTLYALEQMISKGKISSEELRVQMGDQLPGAFGLAAKAMNMTTSELDAALKAGEVMSEDFIPRFAKVLSEKYSGEVDKATAATNKWQESLRDMKVQIVEAGVLDIMTDSLKEATNIIKDPEFIRALSIAVTGFAQLVEYAIKFSGVVVKLSTGFDAFKELEEMRTLPDIMNIDQLNAEVRTLEMVLKRLRNEGNENTITFIETQKRLDEVNSRIKMLSQTNAEFIYSINESTKTVKSHGDTTKKVFLSDLPKGLQTSIDAIEKFKEEYEKTFLSATEIATKQIEKQAEEFEKAGVNAVKVEEWKNEQLKKLYEKDTENHKKEQGKKSKELSKRIDDSLDKYFGYLDTQEKEIIKQIEKEEKDRQKAADRIAKQQEKMWEGIQEDTADILFNMLDDYENAWDNLADSVLDIFKRMLAEMAAQALTQTIVVPVVQQIQGALGLGGAGVPSGGGGGISNILGMGRQALGLGQQFGLFGGGGIGLGFAGGGGVSGYLSALMGTQVGALPTQVGTMLGGGAMYGPGAAAGGLTYGALGAAGGIGALGYGMLAGPLGLPQGPYSGLGAGLGGAGGFALGGTLGSIFPALSTFGGPIGLGLGALFGGALGGLFGADKPHKFRTEYGIDIADILAPQLEDISYMRAAGRQEKGYVETRQKMEQMIDEIYTPQIEQLRSFIDTVSEAGVDVEAMLGDLATYSYHETVSTRSHIERDIEITMDRIAQDFSQYAEDVLGVIMPEYNKVIMSTLEEQTKGPIDEFIKSLKLGPLSVALPTEKFEMAGSEYQQLFQQVMGGDQAAIQELITFAPEYLGLAQEVYKSSVQYQAVFSSVIEDLESIKKYISGNNMGFADGGISTGPESGHFELLHGTEAIVPLKNGAIPVQISDTQQKSITVIVEIDGEKISTEEIAMVADEIRVKADRRGMQGQRIY